MSWEQLLAIRDEYRAIKRQEEAEPPTSCPIDGTLLQINDRGVRNCPMGNFTWLGGSKAQPLST